MNNRNAVKPCSLFQLSRRPARPKTCFKMEFFDQLEEWVWRMLHKNGFLPVLLSPLSSYRRVPCSICRCLTKPSHPWSPVNILYCTQPHLYPLTSRRTLHLWANLSLYSLTHAWWVVHTNCVTIVDLANRLYLPPTYPPPASTAGREWSRPKRGPAPIRNLLLLASPTSAASFSAHTVSSSRASASGASLRSGKNVPFTSNPH